ncbi:MAG: hypothetical protein ACPGJV_14080 [Bacteriovoracaceae bacterium]
MKNSIKYTFIFIALAFFLAGKTFAQDDQIEKVERFLQVKRINIPKPLEEIDFEIQQNAVDVVINSNKYIFLTSKRKKIVNKNYKNHNSLEIKLNPIPGSDRAYNAEFRLSNWYSEKFDRTVKTKVRKFNLLTDFRMGIYELLYGRDFIKKNREKLIQYSANRIKRIAEIAEQKRKEKKANGQSIAAEEDSPQDRRRKELESPENKQTKQKNEKQDENSDDPENAKKDKEKDPEEEDKKSEIPANKKSDPSQSDDEQSKKKKDSDKKDSKETKEQASNKTPKKKKRGIFGAEDSDDPQEEQKELGDTDAPDVFLKRELYDNVPEVYIEKVSKLTGVLKYNTFATKSTAILEDTELDLSFFIFGVDFSIKEFKLNPWEYSVSMMAGSSVETDDYEIPAWLSIDLGVYKYILSDFLKLGIQVEYSPYYLVNLPIVGEGTQLYELNVKWWSAFAGVRLRALRREFLFYGILSNSFGVSSSIDGYEASASRMTLGAKIQVLKKYSLAFETVGFNLTGTDNGTEASSTGEIYSLNLLYQFN